MTRIGYVDCISNAFDSFELANGVVEKKIAGASLTRLTAPEILKIPVCVKKLFTASDVDLVVAFISASGEDFDSLHLVVEKTIDLEVEFSKYVFYCVVSEEEFSTQQQFEKISKKRLEVVLDIAMKALHHPAEVSEKVGSGMDFSSLSALALGAGPENSPTSEEGGDEDKR